MSRVATPLALAALALAGCGADDPEDPAATTPASIPMGAIGARGVGLDGPSARPDLSLVKGKIKPSPGKRAAPVEPLPTAPDPFAEPPEPEAPTPGPKPKGAPHPPHTSSKETTL